MMMMILMCVWGGGRGWGELFTCPYPRKVQACLPGDCRPALRFKVSEQEKKKDEIGQTGKPKGPKIGGKG